MTTTNLLAFVIFLCGIILMDFYILFRVTSSLEKSLDAIEAKLDAVLDEEELDEEER